VTKLEDRGYPWTSLGTRGKPALIRALPAGHCPGATQGVAVLLQQAWHSPNTARATPVPGEDFKHSRGWWWQVPPSVQIRKMRARSLGEDNDRLSLLLQEQDLPAEGRQDEGASEVASDS